MCLNLYYSTEFLFYLVGPKYASIMHRRRKRGGRGDDSPPQVSSWGGIAPPNFTHCLLNELHCSIVDRIACRHCSSRKSHFCCLKKCRPPPSQNIFLRLCHVSMFSTWYVSMFSIWYVSMFSTWYVSMFSTWSASIFSTW